MDVLAFLLQYKAIILFYLLVIAFLVVKRKQLVVQLKFIFLYRTKFGLRWMDSFAKKHRELVVLFGYIGTGVGFLGMFAIIGVMLKTGWMLLSNPSAPSGVSPVLPGINVPGLGVLPFWFWLIALFFIALIHEFSHGIVARAHNIEVKNTGFAFFGPVIGAFVEPNDVKMKKQKDIVQYSVLAAGSFSNILLSLLALVLLMFVTGPIQESMMVSDGFTFDSYVNESLPFAQAGILPGTVITAVNGQKVSRFEDFGGELSCMKPGDSLLVGTKDKDYSVVLAANPDAPTKGFLGISLIRNEVHVKEEYVGTVWSSVYTVLSGLNSFLRWLFVLSLGIGLFNLLPLPLVDGGQMLQLFFHNLRGPENGERWYRRVSLFLLVLLLAALIVPLFF